MSLPRVSVELPETRDLSRREPSPNGGPPEGEDALMVPASSGDISTGGVGFVLSAGTDRLSVRDRVTVRIALPDSFDEILVRAEVRHVAASEDGTQRVGAAFLDADELIQHPLYRYIEEALLAVRATTGSYHGELHA